MPDPLIASARNSVYIPKRSVTTNNDRMKTYIQTDLAKSLGNDDHSIHYVVNGTRPELHMTPIALRSAMPRAPVKTAGAVLIPLMPAAFVWIVVFLLSLDGPTNSPAPFIYATIAAVLAYCLVTMAVVSTFFHEHDAKVLRTYASTTPRRLGRIMCDHPLDEIRDATERMKRIAGDHRPQVAAVRRRALAQIMEVDRICRKALSTIGTSDPVPFRKQAVQAALRILDDAEAQIAVIADDIAQRDDLTAHRIGDAFSESMAMIASGRSVTRTADLSLMTADARINRFVDAARRALDVQPDMVDKAGNRVDHLVDVHLPRLLRRHAEASRHARLEDLDSLNGKFAEGIDMIARSIDEGLSMIRSEAADRLRTEVAFLRTRRLEDAIGLDGPQ